MKKTKFSVLALSILLLASCTPAVSSVKEPSSTTTNKVSSTSEAKVSSVTSSSSLPISSSSATSSVVIKPTVEITNNESSIWIGDKLQMTAVFSDEKAYEVIWRVSDDSIATISSSGLITGLRSGDVTVTVESKSDSTITSSHVITVKDTIINTNYGAGNWDYSHLKDENPTISTTIVNAPWPYCETVFNGVVGQKYYFEATFNVTSRADNEWNRISLGHRNVGSNYIFRGLQVSPGTNSGNNKKIVMMETPNNWGDTTDRSQIWNMSGIRNFDFSNLKLSALRNGNDYYYFVNDRLYWMETIDTRFKDIDTMPTIVAADLHCTVSNMFVTTDEDEIDAKLDLPETKRIFYPSHVTNVIIDDSVGRIQFKNNNDGAPFNNIKDNCARSIGDAFSIEANKSATIEFDLTFDEFGSDPTSSIVALTFNRYSSGPSNARSLVVNKYAAGYTPWDYNGDMPVSFFKEVELNAPFAKGDTHHITVTRTVTENGQVFKMSVDNVDMGFTEGDEYNGALTLTFGCLKANATLTNISLAAL